ncbi:hypothetical protein BpHYR1_048969 [Brachionus plicatilis]|uniref:Uncharacterized protein n=1 Tax=Brachionus plicatilis TaxID=10195 RepID=A0A3M7PVK7_BRAPC|nr:hypothetical protein BpHYR1_048969 [Brachionus plicatilis]
MKIGHFGGIGFGAYDYGIGTYGGGYGYAPSYGYGYGHGYGYGGYPVYDYGYGVPNQSIISPNPSDFLFEADGILLIKWRMITVIL